MTVFIAHAPADRQAAEGLEKVIERRGQFAELDDGQTALRPVQPSDVLVLLVSQALVFATARLRLEQRALDAWAAGRLVVVKLDRGIAPVGLRDLPAIDASFEAQREFKWNEVADAIREKLKARAAPRAPSGGRPWSDQLRKEDAAGQDAEARGDAQMVARRVGAADRVSLIACVLVMLPGLAAFVTAGAIWLVNRIGATPGTFADLIAGVDAFGAARGALPGVTPMVFAVAIVVALLAPFALKAYRASQRKKLDAYAREHPEIYEDYEAPPSAPRTDAMFVSYARANSEFVMPVIKGAESTGRKFWVDTQSIGAGDGWAGEIVRAIKSAAGVVVMCSKAAFESDHVKREIYLADRYRKKLVPVFIEKADPPEDFEYFFAGVQSLNLFETPEAERPEALNRVLGAAT